MTPQGGSVETGEASTHNRRLKSESDRERVYEVELSDGTLAHDIERLADGNVIGTERVRLSARLA